MPRQSPSAPPRRHPALGGDAVHRAAFLCVFANFVAPAAVFEFLLASSGAIALLVYLVIAVSQLRMRPA
jgi:L-asparagine transporter-like permease